MAKRLDSLDGCLSMTVHHIAKHKITLMMAGGLTLEDLEYRFKIVRENCEAAMQQLAKIRDAAKKAGHEDILKLIDEKTVPCGHDR